jgi:hypothetical protein
MSKVFENSSSYPTCTCGKYTAVEIKCPVHQLINEFTYDPKTLIPHGDYCYSYTGRMLINNRVISSDGSLKKIDSYYLTSETKTCPFWKATVNQGAICSFLNIESNYGDIDLLWDQIKICNINRIQYNDINEYLYNNIISEEELQSRERIKNRNQQFLESLVNILIRSESNNFKYDNINYTLSKYIIDDFKIA